VIVTPTKDFSMTCSNCKFFNVAQTECRRYAPSPAETDMKAQWPTVASEDWCGEFVALGEDRAAA